MADLVEYNALDFVNIKFFNHDRCISSEWNIVARSSICFNHDKQILEAIYIFLSCLVWINLNVMDRTFFFWNVTIS